jgi:hypothetical protein
MSNTDIENHLRFLLGEVETTAENLFDTDYLDETSRDTFYAIVARQHDELTPRPITPMDATFNWLISERDYQINKFGIGLDDQHTIEFGVQPETWWQDQVAMYLHRANLFGLDTPQGRQMVAKATATMCGLLESVIRVHGELPPPGVSSGNLDGVQPE